MKGSRAYCGFLVPRRCGWSAAGKSDIRHPKSEGRPKSEVRTHPFFRSLVLLLVCASACFGQKNAEPGPAPLDPVQGEQEGRALVAKLLAQKPEQNVTNTGWVKIRDAAGRQRQIPARFEVYATPTNWVSVYETLGSADGPGGTRLTVVHTGGQPNRYTLVEPGAAGGTNAVGRALTPEQTMVPFAGSDFWVADLGLEFLHWPVQQVLRHEMRRGKWCKVLESVNPQPVPGGYARVVSLVMIESPHGIVHAEAYDVKGDRLKQFDPKSLEKVQGEYQLEEMEMGSRKGTRTVIKFELGRE
jgi:hypothetical protein